MGRAVTGYGRMWIAAAGAACAVALAGCNGAEAGPTPSESAASSSTSTTTTPTGSTTTSSPSGTATVTIPAAARERTPEGAKAFAAFYIASVSESGFTANASTLRAVSAPTCKGCQVFIEFAEELRAADQHVDRKSMRLNGMAVRPDSTADLVIVDCLVEDQPSRIVDSRGGVVSNEPGEKLALRISVKWLERGWIVAESLLVEGK